MSAADVAKGIWALQQFNNYLGASAFLASTTGLTASGDFTSLLTVAAAIAGLTSAVLMAGAAGTAGAPDVVAVAVVFVSCLCRGATWAALSCVTTDALTAADAAGVAAVADVGLAGVCAKAPTEEITRAAVIRESLIISVSRGMATLP